MKSNALHPESSKTDHEQIADTPDPETIATTLRNKGTGTPDCSIILGSGLGMFTGVLENSVVVPYSEIPGFPETSVVGHDGAVHFGMIGSKKVLAWAGRFHHYEGHAFARTILPVQVANALGSQSMLVTNAAGGINERFRVGDLMLIDDIITLLVSVNPHNQPLNRRYANDKIVNEVTRLATRAGIPVTRGCYLFAKGPSYESKAEIRAFRTLGADAVGMSTAAELYEAIRLNMTCLGISLITNLATGVSKKKLDHSDIKEAANQSEKDFITLISRIITDEESPIC